MDHFQRIYANDAARYDRLISAEDADGNLLRVLRGLAPLEGSVVVDVATGTGRIPRLVAPYARAVWGMDLHLDMLRVNASRRAAIGGSWAVCRGDVRQLPFRKDCADLVTAAWALGHFTDWHRADWRSEAARALDEMLRVSKPGGQLVVLETLSTGVLAPAPPTAELAEYYDWLGHARGMSCSCIRTDYQFASAREAAEAVRFFFGDALSERILERAWARVPEWTGVWTLRK
jgi:ubiquinone/menaquinone biosynthesis C-methylase UbiE